MKNVSGNICRENQNKYFMFIDIFSFEIHAVYEIMLKNIVQRGRPQTTIWRMQIVCWIAKATNIFSEYVTLIALQQQHRLHERVSLLRYTYTACLIFNVIMKVYRNTLFPADGRERLFKIIYGYVY